MRFFFLFLTLILISFDSFAFLEKISSKKNTKEKELPAVLKADDISGDGLNNNIIATGNVEVTKGRNTIYADKASYDKSDKIVKVEGNVKANNIEIGNLRASKGWAKDDLSQAEFEDGILVFNDGSYTRSDKVKRENIDVTILQKAVYSLCPNPEIVLDSIKADDNKGMVSIKTKSTEFNRRTNKVKIKNGIIRIYDFPVFFVPYLNLPLPGQERKSGFLYPSYVKSDRLGVGIKTPYYVNIAPNKDLTVTPQTYLNTGNLIVNNEFRHLLKSGRYNVNLEFANNKIDSNNDTTIANRTDDNVRWLLKSEGKFDFKNNFGADFDINNVGDRDYYRDYQNSYVGYTKSEINFDHIKDRNYNSIKTIRFQELENFDNSESAQFVLPTINSYFETDPVFFKERFSLLTNFTSINKESGLQYNRLSFKPAVKVPFNFSGNLFEVNSSVTANNYYLKDNFKFSDPAGNNYSEFEFSYKPEISFDWRLPLIRKTESKTIMIEPRANVVYSSYDSKNLPNEDSNLGELNASNLFSHDRIAGFDRFESGKRLNYGFKSFLANDTGQYGFSLGQSLRDVDEEDNIEINGFNDNNKSNIIGDFSFIAKKHFSMRYSFHLNESDYRNDVNQFFAGFDFKRVKFSGNYLLLRKTLQNEEEKQQINFDTNFKISEKWGARFSNTRDIVEGTNLSRLFGISYNGCCAVLSISVSENNLENFIKPERSVNINFSLRNL